MKLAIFDFNGTIFKKETLPYLLSCWYKNSYSGKRLAGIFFSLLPLFLKYKTGLSASLSREEMEIEAMYRFSHIFSGMSKKEVVEFFKRASDSASIFYNKRILYEINKNKERGFHTVLLSGAFFLFLVQVGTGLKIDTIIGSELPFNKGYYDSGKKLKLIKGGKDKLERLIGLYKQDTIDWESSCAYADSINDLPLLEAVGHPFPVEPDSHLKKVALERGWTIIE